jgi:hypothetical protein
MSTLEAPDFPCETGVDAALSRHRRPRPGAPRHTPLLCDQRAKGRTHHAARAHQPLRERR